MAQRTYYAPPEPVFADIPDVEVDTTDPTHVRHGYTLKDIDVMARRAFYMDRSLTSDAHTRYSTAWSAIAEHLCAAERVPDGRDLIQTGWQAIYQEVREMRQMFSLNRDQPNGLEPSKTMAVKYWYVPRGDPEDDRVSRMAAPQILAALGAPYRDAVVALALHDDYQAAADALGIKYTALTARLTVARREFRRHWFAPESAPAVTGTDRRIGSRNKALATHCGSGHELTGDNVYRRPNPKPGKRGERVCRMCERERSSARAARAKAARNLAVASIEGAAS